MCEFVIQTKKFIFLNFEANIQFVVHVLKLKKIKKFHIIMKVNKPHVFNNIWIYSSIQISKIVLNFWIDENLK